MDIRLETSIWLGKQQNKSVNDRTFAYSAKNTNKNNKGTLQTVSNVDQEFTIACDTYSSDEENFGKVKKTATLRPWIELLVRFLTK